MYFKIFFYGCVGEGGTLRERRSFEGSMCYSPLTRTSEFPGAPPSIISRDERSPKVGEILFWGLKVVGSGVGDLRSRM